MGYLGIWDIPLHNPKLHAAGRAGQEVGEPGGPPPSWSSRGRLGFFYHARYDWRSVEFLGRAGIDARHLPLEAVGATGNGHFMFTETNGDVIAERVSATGFKGSRQWKYRKLHGLRICGLAAELELPDDVFFSGKIVGATKNKKSTNLNNSSGSRPFTPRKGALYLKIGDVKPPKY